MIADGIKNEQVWVTRLIKHYYKVGPSQRQRPSSSLRSLRSVIPNEEKTQHWIKLTKEEKTMLEQLCEYHDCIAEGRTRMTKYRYSQMIYLFISNSYYLRVEKTKKQAKTPRKELSDMEKYVDELVNSLSGEENY